MSAGASLALAGLTRATALAKLFNLVQPNVAVFGRKGASVHAQAVLRELEHRSR